MRVGFADITSGDSREGRTGSAIACLHTPSTLTPENVFDTRNWEFFIWASAEIEAAIPPTGVAASG